MDRVIDYANAQLIGVQVSPAPRQFSPRNTLVVSEVADGSPARLAGVAPGDYLLTVNGDLAVEQGSMVGYLQGPVSKYLFRRQTQPEAIEVETTGVNPGVRLKRSPQAIVASVRSGLVDNSDLFELWDAGEWKLLKTVCHEDLQAGYKPGLWQRLSKGPAAWQGFANPATFMMLGVAEYELGNRSKGIEYLQNIDREFLPSWLEYDAIYLTTMAEEMQRKGQTKEARELIADAYERHPFSRIAELFECFGMQRPSRPEMLLNEAFPVDYDLQVLEGGTGKRSLKSALSALQPGQIFLVCLLAGYRSNTPYGQFMQRYRKFAKQDFKPWLGGIHVITGDCQDYRGQPVWQKEGEERARRAKLDVPILCDPRNRIADELQLRGSPEIKAIIGDGRIVHSDITDEVDMWNALYRAEAFAVSS